ESAATLVLVHGGPAAGERDVLGNPIIHPPNFPTLHVGQMQSEHPGGAHALMGDGGLRYLPNDVDLQLFSSMMSIAEREVINDTDLKAGSADRRRARGNGIRATRWSHRAVGCWPARLVASTVLPVAGLRSVARMAYRMWRLS